MGQPPDSNQCSGKAGLDRRPTDQQQIWWSDFLGGNAPCPSRFLAGIADQESSAAAAASEAACAVAQALCAVAGAACAEASPDCAEAAAAAAAGAGSAAAAAGVASAADAEAVYAAAAAGVSAENVAGAAAGEKHLSEKQAHQFSVAGFGEILQFLFEPEQQWLPHEEYH